MESRIPKSPLKVLKEKQGEIIVPGTPAVVEIYSKLRASTLRFSMFIQWQCDTEMQQKLRK